MNTYEQYIDLHDRIVSANIDTGRVEILIQAGYKGNKSIKKTVPFFEQPFIHFITSCSDIMMIYCRGIVKDRELVETFFLYLEETKLENRKRILNAKSSNII